MTKQASRDNGIRQQYKLTNNNFHDVFIQTDILMILKISFCHWYVVPVNIKGVNQKNVMPSYWSRAW
jgi:hypothetical protein